MSRPSDLNNRYYIPDDTKLVHRKVIDRTTGRPVCIVYDVEDAEKICRLLNLFEIVEKTKQEAT